MQRIVSWLFATALTVFMFAACGRAGIEDFDNLDGGGGEGGTCGPLTCPSGCCDSQGICRLGTDLQACGGFGRSCNDCLATGRDTCDRQTKTCGKQVDKCDANSCPLGCCGIVGGSEVCLTGIDTDACGTGGASCARCGDRGQTCDTRTRQCGGNACDANSCPNGCCVGAACVGGRDANACGSKGVKCSDCAAQGQQCRGAAGQFSCVGTPACSPANCRGCCEGNSCVGGTDLTACGQGGLACGKCNANLETCTAGKCIAKPNCGPGNCNGCCVNNQCVGGNTPAACGASGNACRGCAIGEVCTAGTCVKPPACGPLNCNGCCVGDQCVAGAGPGSDTACGLGGAQCANCAGDGKTCAGGICKAAACTAATCPNGCCQNDVCVAGVQNNTCGRSGAVCANCTAQNQICNGGICQAPCNAANCPGCCEGNTCRGGFLNTRCGSNGAACADCAAQLRSCDTNKNPRVCTAGGSCPAAYNACPAPVATAKVVAANVCNPQTLQDARVACDQGANTPACVAFFQFLAQVDVTCGTCLTPFNTAFTERAGIYACISSVSDVACNRQTGCRVDCEQTSCTQCGPGQQAACLGQVDVGQCQAFTLAADQCTLQAFLGGGAFCNPGAYNGNFGAWLQGVGTRLCAAP